MLHIIWKRDTLVDSKLLLHTYGAIIVIVLQDRKQKNAQADDSRGVSIVLSINFY